MLGRHADHFFRKQASERVLAQPANGASTSLQYFDRGDRGTGQVRRVPGRYEVPGPQNAISSNMLAGAAAVPEADHRDMLPGMGVHRDMMPGMGEVHRDMLPGMGDTHRDMLPGMGFVDQVPGGWLTIGGGAAAFYLLFIKGNLGRSGSSRRRARRRARRAS